MTRETEKLSLTMIDGKPTDGTSASKKRSRWTWNDEVEEFVRNVAPRRRIDQNVFCQDGHGVMNVDFFQQVFWVLYTNSSDYSVYDGGVHTLTCCTHIFLLHTLFAHIRTFSCVCTHAWLKFMKKVFVARVSLFSISSSPFSCFTRLCRSCPQSCRIFSYSKRRKCAVPHMHREVWLDQVRCTHRLWAQWVRQDHFCGQWHDVHWRSRLRWNLWLLEKHTREHWTVRCLPECLKPLFRTFLMVFCSSNRRQRKHASENRLQDRERKEEVLWSVLQSWCQRKVDGTVSGVLLFVLTGDSLLMYEISENILNEELKKLLLVKIQFRENYIWMRTRWRSRIWSEDMSRLSHSVSLNLKDSNYWEPIRASSTWENTYVLRIGDEGSFSSRKQCEKLPRNWRMKKTLLLRGNIENQRRLEEFPTQHYQESRTVSLLRDQVRRLQGRLEYN